MPISKDRLYQKKSGGTFYGWFYDSDGSRRYVCTWCRDRRAAATALRRIERQAQAPGRLPTDGEATTLSDALTRFIEYTRDVRRRSPHTVASYLVKAGHLLRLLGSTADINAFRPGLEETYVTKRRSEAAGDNTIHKELVVLRATMKRAAREGRFFGSLDALRTDHSPNYTPRRRYLTRDEYVALVRALAEKRRATVAFIVLTAARDSEWRAVQREHVDLNGVLLLPGTKTERARRRLPLRHNPDLHALLTTVMKSAPTSGAVFAPWSNIVATSLKVARRRASLA